MKRKIKTFMMILLAAGVVGGGYWYYSQNPEALVQLQLQLGLISQAEASGVYSVSGFIEAEEIEVAAETGGRIIKISVDEGDFVEAGQILVELDTALLEAEVKQAAAKVATARAYLAKIEAGVRPAEIGKAEAAVAVAEAVAHPLRLLRRQIALLHQLIEQCRSGHGHTLTRSFSASLTAFTNARIRVGSFMPGLDSTPLLTSTPWGRTVRTASVTLSGVSPPARTI
jgi:multidrug efflux pump subunit AcrA (membrane-fusion protein)